MKFLERISDAAARMEAATAESLRRVQFQSAAEESIKTGGYSCALEEQVMKEAAAREKERLVALGHALDKDPVLRRLFEGYVGNQDLEIRGTVRGRRIGDEVAMESAVRMRRQLDELAEKGADFRRRYYAKCAILEEKLNLTPQAGGTAPQLIADGSDRVAMLFGRHTEEWIEEVERPTKR